MGRKKYESHNPFERKKRERENGFLAIDNQGVTSHLQTSKVAKAEQVAAFLISVVFHHLAAGVNKVTFFLDNARTHKKKMKTLFNQHLKEFGMKDQVEVEFVHIPPYSPKMNAAEYFIQIIRKRFLKHLPPNQNIQQVLDRLIPLVEAKQLLSPQQMNNIISRIKRCDN